MEILVAMNQNIRYYILENTDRRIKREKMNINDIELQDCPLCHGAGFVEDEQGWCVYVTCIDCDAHTVEMPYKNDAEKAVAIEKAAHLWNIGKVISGCPNE